MTLVLDESLESYHEHPALSHSKLKDFAARGPRYYWLRHLRKELDGKDTKALIAGRAFETYLFEPLEFEKLFAVKPEGKAGNGSTIEGKAWKQATEASGRIILPRSDFAGFEYMTRAVQQSSTAQAFLSGGHYQPTYRAEFAGLPGIQSRPDFANEDGIARTEFQPYTLDLKTIDSLAPKRTGETTDDIIARAIATYGYHCQAACAQLASAGVMQRHFLLLVEKQIPNRAVVREIDAEFVSIGQRWCEQQLDALAMHYASDQWPLGSDDVGVVRAPSWLVTQQWLDEDEADEGGDEYGAAAEAP